MSEAIKPSWGPGRWRDSTRAEMPDGRVLKAFGDGSWAVERAPADVSPSSTTGAFTRTQGAAQEAAFAAWLATFEDQPAALKARLAATVAALENAERKLSAYVGVCAGDKELTGAIPPQARAAIAAAKGGAR